MECFDTALSRRNPSQLSWFLLMAIVAIMLGTLLGRPAFAAPPPAGTSIGNQASATYTDASGITRTVTSNIVQTVVTQVASLTLTQNGTQTATPGTIVYFPHTLTNTGNGVDTFNLSAVSATGFTPTSIQIFADNGSGQPTGSPITSTGPLASGAAFKFIVAIALPTAVTTGSSNTVTITGTSAFTSSVSAQNQDVTNVTSNAVITVTKSISASSGTAGSGPITYTLTYTNTGNSTATNVQLTDQIPSGMTYVAGSSLWSVTGTSALPDSGTTGTSPNTITTNNNVASGALSFTMSQVTPGQSGTVSFQVKVGPSTPAGILNNTANFSYLDGSGSTTPVTGNSNTVAFTVNPTAAVALTGATVASAVPGSTVSFTNVVTNNGNATDTFNITINTSASTFPTGTTFVLYKSDGVTPLTDTNGDGVPDTGPLAPGASYDVIVKAQLPADANGGPFSVSKQATSANNPAVSATATDTLTTVTGDTVDLTANGPYNAATPAIGQGPGPEASPVVTQPVSPGKSTTFTLFVNNTGPVSDSYNLAASSASSFSSINLPAGWTVTFKADGGAGNCSTTGAAISNTGPVAAGSDAVVCAVVTTPAAGPSVLPGANVLYFRGVSPASGAQDTLTAAVDVQQFRAIAFNANNSNQTYPGGTVVYTHTLTNNGNVVEGDGSHSAITMAIANNQTGWTSVLYLDINNTGVFASNDPVIPASGLAAVLSGGLAPGQSVTIFDKVTAPSGAAIGLVNTTNITITTSAGSYTVAAPAPVTAADSTSVIAGNLQLTKQQALDANCTGPSPATAYGSASINAGPGQCVIYQITVTNVGSANATSVVVSDATPNYTTFEVPTGSNLPATTIGTVTGPAAGSSGTISATIGTLTPAQSATVVFEVRIDH